ncbi:type I polyketide synthase [Nocardia pseudovaccinii]|uniref:type I polyketide synthase n=1 Tax=Nocardia pseudovaccinii TaxID=189540 RepID=UPI0007A4D0A1|nr:type I polyketide synthase [Nocardia pseudovaccinii]
MSTADTASVRPDPPVSIVGIGCRVPGAPNVSEFWRMLCDGRDATGAPPPDRPGTRHAGYLTDVDAFDNDWFAISGREAALMDPQQRLALEVAIEALDDAGIGHRTRGSGAAVVFGACAYDHGIAVLGRAGHDAPYAVTGSALSIIANRLSYVLDLHGPSLVVDSACSSSLVAVDLAVRLLADEAVPFAIVGGVNLTLLPHTSEYLAEGGFLAPDGRCKPFDAAADGYARGDGCTVVVLRRTADALRDGHRVYAEILGTAIGSDGRSNGLYAPNGRAQQEIIRTAWARAGLDPHDVGYVECHGTGTPLGDAVEVGALAAVVASDAEPIWIGSLKSNIGHLEAAAGITGMVKAALSIRQGVIPPTINFHTENPLLKLTEHGLRVPTEPVDWTDTPVGARCAGVSSFGFGGTNAHVVLRGLEAVRHRSYEPPVLLPVTGRDIAELRSHALRWAELLEGAGMSSNGTSGDSSSSMSNAPHNRPGNATRDGMSSTSRGSIPSHDGIGTPPGNDTDSASCGDITTPSRDGENSASRDGTGNPRLEGTGLESREGTSRTSRDRPSDSHKGTNSDSLGRARRDGLSSTSEIDTGNASHDNINAPSRNIANNASRDDTGNPRPEGTSRTSRAGTSDSHKGTNSDSLGRARRDGLSSTSEIDTGNASRDSLNAPWRNGASTSWGDTSNAQRTGTSRALRAHTSDSRKRMSGDSREGASDDSDGHSGTSREGTNGDSRERTSSTSRADMDAATNAVANHSGAGSGDREILRQFAAAAARLIPENARAAVVARDLDDAVDQLRALAGGEPGSGVIGAGSVRRRGGVLFLFSGQGGQYSKMGRSLAARYPVFAQAVTAAADAIAAAGGGRVWTPRNGFALGGAASNGSSATELVQPAIFAFQVALAELLSAWRIEPDAVVGHSLGEVAGAAVSGALSLSDAARVVVQRSRILARLDGHGAMAVLEATADEAARLVEPLHATVAVAAINGPRSVVISGAPRYIDALVRRAKRRQIFAQRIAVDFAAHSPQVGAFLPEFVDTLGGLTAQVPRVPVYSTARRCETITTAAMDADYWAENASRTVDLAAALQKAADDGFATVLEIAPHPVLTSAIREFPEFADATHTVTTRDNEAGAFLTCLAKLYLEGRPLNWAANGPFTAPPPARQWSHRRFPLITTLDPGTTYVAATEPDTTNVTGTKPRTSYVPATQPDTTSDDASESGTTRNAATDPRTTRDIATQPDTTNVPATEPSTSYVAAAEPRTAHDAATKPNTATKSGIIRDAATKPSIRNAATEPDNTYSAATKPTTTGPVGTKAETTYGAATDNSAPRDAATEPSSIRNAATEPDTSHRAATKPTTGNADTTYSTATDNSTPRDAATDNSTPRDAATKPTTTGNADTTTYTASENSTTQGAATEPGTTHRGATDPAINGHTVNNSSVSDFGAGIGVDVVRSGRDTHDPNATTQFAAPRGRNAQDATTTTAPDAGGGQDVLDSNTTARPDTASGRDTHDANTTTGRDTIRGRNAQGADKPTGFDIGGSPDAHDWNTIAPFGTARGRDIHATNTTSGFDISRSRDAVDSGASSVFIAESEFPADDLHDHVVQGVPTVPAVFWLLRLIGLAGAGRAIGDFVVHERTGLAALSAVTYRAGGAGRLQAEVTGAGTLASARLAGDPTPGDIVAWMRVVDANRAARRRMRVLTPGVFYDSLRARQLDYGPGFRALREIEAGPDCAVGLFDSAPPQRSATLDGCLHLLAAASWDHLPADAIALPIGIESAWLSAEPDLVLLEAHALVRDRSTNGLTGDIIGTDQHGVPVLALSGVRIRFATVESTTQVGPFRHETWIPYLRHAESNGQRNRTMNPQRALVVGESQLAIRLARELDRTLPTERVAREPDAAGPIVSAVLAGRTGTADTAVVVVWPTESGATHTGDAIESAISATATTGRVLDLLQRVQSEDTTASLTIVLPEPGTTDHQPPARSRQHSSPDKTIMPMAVAGLVRSMQLESGLDVRLVWTDTSPPAVSRLRELIATAHALPDELRISADAITARRFILTRPRPTTPTPIDPNGTYVVTGGLGALGSVAVRWLLDAGAHDVVVLTRAPRPVPAVLDGLEDRIVVVRCDAADRSDLANALDDVRECGSTIRGVVHAAGALEDAAFEAVTARQLARMFAPKPIAANNLIELTAADPTDFVLLFSSATGALGAPGQAAYASANAAMDALAHRHRGRRVLSIGWGVWDSGLTESAGGAAHLRRAGISAFDIPRGTELLARTLHYNEPYLLALDYTPTADPDPVATRLRNLLTDQPITVPASPNPIPPRPSEPLTTTIRTALAVTLDLTSDHVDPEADFNELGLSSLLGIEMRRHLESRLNIRISTAELFQYPTITALGAALADRVAAAKSDGVL